MARGWESKSVEAQKEDLEREQSEGAVRAARSREEAVRAERRETLRLIRSRIADQVGSARTEPQRQMLAASLAAIDAESAGLA